MKETTFSFLSQLFSNRRKQSLCVQLAGSLSSRRCVSSSFPHLARRHGHAQTEISALRRCFYFSFHIQRILKNEREKGQNSSNDTRSSVVLSFIENFHRGNADPLTRASLYKSASNPKESILFAGSGSNRLIYCASYSQVFQENFADAIIRGSLGYFKQLA